MLASTAKALCLGLIATAAVLLGPGRAADAAGGAVTVAVGADITNGDPHQISGGNEYIFHTEVFEGLYGHDLQGRLEPHLATSHTMSADGLTYEFKLRQGVTFHDGQPFTAEDVRYSWQRATKPETKNPRAAVLVANIQDVAVVDDHSVKITLKKPDASMLENMGEYFYIVPRVAAAAAGDNFGKNPIGSGPYKFVERKVKDYIVLDAYKQHWGRVPDIDRLTFKIVQDSQTRVAMLRTGEADIIVDVPPHVAKSVDGGDTKLIKVPSFQNIFVTITNRNPAFAPTKVRQALNHAIDRKTMIDKVMFGYATASAAPCAIGVVGCDIGKEPYAYDEKKAKQLLTEAGFDFSKTYRFVGIAPGRLQQSKEVAEAIQFYLNKVGVKTKLDIMEYGAWLAFVTAQKYSESDLNEFTWTDYNNDPMGRLGRSNRTDGALSWVTYPEVDRMIERANTIVDPKEREQFLRELFTKLYDDPPVIILWTVDMLYGVRKGIDWTPAANVSWPVMWKIKKG